MSVEERKSKEAQFHDELYKPSEKKGKPLSFYRDDFIEAIRDHAFRCLGDMDKKKILFYGCGVQWSVAARFYEQGAEVVMIDISGGAIEILKRKISEEKQADRIKPMVMDCESLDFDASSFDLVFGNAVIHHLDIPKAINELHRVMKPGGSAVFIEPLGMNPLLNLYRRFTPDLRTPDEHPLTYGDFNIFEDKFTYFRHDEFTLLTLIPVVWNAVAERFRMFLLRTGRFMEMDRRILQRFPRLGRFCWNTVIHVRK